MRTTPFVLLTALVTLAVTAGCSVDTKPAASTPTTSTATQPAATQSATPPTTTAAAPTATASPNPGGAPTTDSDTKKVCADVTADIQTFLAKVKEAEAIGPPAGHFAVSAQFSAGAAAIYAHTAGMSGTATTAAKRVADAMSAIAGKYVDANSKPDKSPLNAAIKAFKDACAAGS